MTGVQLRLGKLFNKDTRRSFIVAFDHGQALPIPHGMGNPVRLLESIIAGKPDGLLLTKGMLQQASRLLAHREAPAVIVRGDWSSLDPSDKESFGEHHRQILDPADALRMGADAMCVYLIAGVSNDEMFPDNIEAVATVIDKAHRVGLPVIVESVLWGNKIADKHDFELLRKVCRQAAEIGADALKTEYLGDEEKERILIEEVGDIPVLTLGGAVGGMDEVAKAAEGAIRSGARGLIFGRNAWQAGEIEDRLATLSKITHTRFDA